MTNITAHLADLRHERLKEIREKIRMNIPLTRRENAIYKLLDSDEKQLKDFIEEVI